MKKLKLKIEVKMKMKKRQRMGLKNQMKKMNLMRVYKKK